VVPLGEGLTGAAATRMEPVMVGDVRNDPRYLPSVDAVRSELAVPMIARGHLVGVIDLQSTRLNAYVEEDRTLVRLIASRAAASIENARLYRRTLDQNNTLRTLAALAHNFSSTLDLDELLNKIAGTVRKLIGYDAFSILLLEEDRKRLRRRFSMRFDERVDLDHVPLGHGITGAAVDNRQPVLVRDTRGDARYIQSTEGIRSEVAVPLIVPDRLLGVMDLESTQVGQFTEDHLRMLELLAPLIANSVENARLYEELGERERSLAHNLHAARDLQNTLLLRQPPAIEGLEVAARHRAAQEVSGDLYDFFTQPDGLEVIAFGDVSGKGAAAALYGTLVAGLLRTLAPRGKGPGVLMRSMNAVLGERKVPATYVTLLLLFWQRQDRTLTMSNAGMFPPIVCRNGKVLKQHVEGIPIGLLDNRYYDEVVFQSEPGDVVLLYSDGIHDQQAISGQDYGREPLYSLLEKHWSCSAGEIADAVLADVDRFASGATLGDDQTLVVCKVI
jgi:sigma-B regulation protein RsbU (phosphoserine phosphatase)